MDFKILDPRTKILFLIAVVFLYATLGTLITTIITGGIIHILFLILTLWFASTSSLIFHYLLWKNLEFLRNVNWNNINHFGFIISVCSYIILFPIICLLTVTFLFIFSIIILILVINNLTDFSPHVLVEEKWIEMNSTEYFKLKRIVWNI